MRELRDIVAAWARLGATAEPAVLATVVETAGSSYRRPGARLLLSSERWMAGGVSGGCLERDLLSKAWWRTREGAVVVTYDSTSAEDDEVWSFGLGCNGRVDVLLERVGVEGPTHPLAFLRECLQRRRPGLMATIHRSTGGPARVGQRLLLSADGVRTDIESDAIAGRVRERAEAALAEGRTEGARVQAGGAACEVLFEVVRPPRSLVVFGSGQDVVPLVRLGALLGFHLTVVRNSPAAAPAEGFREADVQLVATPASVRGAVALEPDGAVVIMTHNLEHDAGYLRFALEADCPYVGVLGPRARTERLLRMVEGAGHPISDTERERLFSPVGLHLRAEQPEDIALSILAEVQAVFNRSDGRSLRRHPGPIHD